MVFFVLCIEEKGVPKSTSEAFNALDRMLNFDIKHAKNYLAGKMISEQPKVQNDLDKDTSNFKTAILTLALRPFQEIPEANRKSVLAECITFLKPPGPRDSNELPEGYLIDPTKYCLSNITECVERKAGRVGVRESVYFLGFREKKCNIYSKSFTEIFSGNLGIR